MFRNWKTWNGRFAEIGDALQRGILNGLGASACDPDKMEELMANAAVKLVQAASEIGHQYGASLIKPSVEAQPAPVVPPHLAPGSVLNLCFGWHFTIDEIVELDVDDSLSVDEINQRACLNMERDWEYLGAPPVSGQRKVKAAIGHLNRNWTEEQVTKLLSKPGCPLQSSGAWVREAFLATRPSYDNKGWIGFPDSQTSRWRFRRSGGVYFPDLWGGGSDWYRLLHWVRHDLSREDRLCLLCGPA